MRLDNTVVLYDNKLYYVLCIADHKPDGIFRVYLDPIGNMWSNNHSVPTSWHDEPGMTKGKKMDDYIASQTGCTILRKHINSPLFKRFRPFPLGFVNSEAAKCAIFTERSPTRHTQQGLTDSMISSKAIQFNPDAPSKLMYRITCTTPELGGTVIGNYPSLEECYNNIVNPDVSNSSAAFHRNFAVFRGPLNIAFLAYKTDVVGVFNGSDHKQVALGRSWTHLKESVDELEMFTTVVCM
jgi:hypothetical protein